MAGKGKRFDTRTILIILLVLCIVGVGYIIVTNLPPEEEYLTPEDVLKNKDTYLDGRTIVVRGYYDSNAVAIVSTMSTTEGKSELPIDYSNVENATDILRNGVKFDFTGVLESVDVGGSAPPGTVVVFVVEKIEMV